MASASAGAIGVYLRIHVVLVLSVLSLVIDWSLNRLANDLQIAPPRRLEQVLFARRHLDFPEGISQILFVAHELQSGAQDPILPG